MFKNIIFYLAVYRVIIGVFVYISYVFMEIITALLEFICDFIEHDLYYYNSKQYEEIIDQLPEMLHTTQQLRKIRDVIPEFIQSVTVWSILSVSEN